MTDRSPFRTSARSLSLGILLCGIALLGVTRPADAGCCKTFPQRHRIVAVESVRPAGNELAINLTLDGMIQGPADSTVTVGQMYGAVLIPDAWSQVSVEYVGQCTVSLDDAVIADLDSEDPAHVQQVMDDYGIPYQQSSAFVDGELVKPEWHPDAEVAAIAEESEPAPEGFHWEGFSSDQFDITVIPEEVTGARIDGVFTTSITILDAPPVGAVEVIVRGGDVAEGLDTVRVPVLVDAGVITLDEGLGTQGATASLLERRSATTSIWLVAGAMALFGLAVVVRGRRR